MFTRGQFKIPRLVVTPRSSRRVGSAKAVEVINPRGTGLLSTRGLADSLALASKCFWTMLNGSRITPESLA